MRSIHRNLPSTTSHEPSPHRSSAVPGIASHPAHVRTAVSGQAAGETGTGGARSSRTYAAVSRGVAERRRHTAHNHSLVHTSDARRPYGDNAPQSRTPTSVLHEQEHYCYSSLDDSQHRQNYEYTNRHNGAFRNNSFLDDPQRHQNSINRHTGSSRNQSQNSSYERSKVGCYNCGEFNHVQVSCRFDHKLRCGICRRLGHKSRLCQYYSR